MHENNNKNKESRARNFEGQENQTGDNYQNFQIINNDN